MSEINQINARAVYVNPDGTFKPEFIKLWNAAVVRGGGFDELTNTQLRQLIEALQAQITPETP